MRCSGPACGPRSAGASTSWARRHDVESAIATITESKPDVVLLDVHLPGGGGTEVLRQIAPRHPEIAFLALSVSDAAEDVVAVIRGGARGYVTRASPATSSSPRLSA